MPFHLVPLHPNRTKKISGPNYEKISIKKRIQSKHYTCSFHNLAIDPQDKNVIWFSLKHTESSGFSKVAPDNIGDGVAAYNWETNQLMHLSTTKGLVTDNVNILVFDPYNNNQIWFGGKDGFSIYDRKKQSFINFTHLNRNPINNIHEIKFDHFNKDYVWIASSGKIIRYTRKSNTIKLVEYDFQDPHKRFIEISNDSVWFGSRVLLGKFSKKDNSLEFHEVHNDYFKNVTPVGKEIRQIEESNRIDILKNQPFISIKMFNNSLYVLTLQGLYSYNNIIEWSCIFSTKSPLALGVNYKQDVLWLMKDPYTIITINKSNEVKEYTIDKSVYSVKVHDDLTYSAMNNDGIVIRSIDGQYEEKAFLSNVGIIHSIINLEDQIFITTSNGLFRYNKIIQGGSEK